VTEADRRPTREQREAIGIRGRDVLLEAGAGTGKTGVLVDRYCELVAGGVSPDAILAFTFTDKAATQLRERARAELLRRQLAGPEEAASLAELVSGFGGAWITTIHGFCRRLLAAHPVAAGIDPRFRVLDASEATRAARAAFDAALEEFLAAGDVEREATVAAYRIDWLRKMIVDVHEELRSRGQDRPRLPEPPVADPGAAMSELERCANEALEAPGCTDLQQRKLARVLEQRAQPPSLDELAGIDLGRSEGLQACAKALRAATSRAAEAGEGGVVYQHARELLRLFHGRFVAEKASRSGLDFEDLQLFALRLLTESEVGEQYRGRFAHLLVDEFQDTNRLQLKLIEALKGPATEVFLVGDEFQSIYGFRHADLAVFREQRDRLASSGGAEVLPLSGNFRSRPEVIAVANAIGSKMLEGFKPLTVGTVPAAELPRSGEPAIELLLTEPRGWDVEGIDLQLPVNDRTPKESVAEARFLAARLRELTEAGIPRGEIVVLLRAFTHVDAFEESLQRAGLRPYVVGGRGYWSQQQVEDLRCLLSVIANPLEDEALLGALASPACGVLPDTLWILRRAAGAGKPLWPALERAVDAWAEAPLEEPDWLAQIPAGDLRRLELFHRRITALREEGPRLALDELVERAIANTGYDLAVLLRGSGELRLANIRKLIGMAREFESNEGRDLRGFLDFVSFRTAEDEEPVAATEAEDHDGVRLMTIHNAKGLEFPVVAVGGLGRGLLGGGRPPDLELGRGPLGESRVGMRLARLGAPSVPLYEREQLREEGAGLESDEELRLFYVGATRARERLLLSGVIPSSGNSELKPGTPVTERLIRCLGVGDLGSDSIVSLPAPEAAPELDTSFAEVEVAVRVNRPSPERAAELVRIASGEAPPAAPGGGPPPIVEPGSPVTPRRPLSYSALQEYRRCGYRFYMERVLGLKPQRPGNGSGGEADSRAFGNAVHMLLEWASTRRWMQPPEGLARRVLAGQGLDPEAAERALQLVRGWLESPLWAELTAEPGRLRSEVRFLLELAGSVVRGTIDLLAEPPSGAPTVVDYKTDRLNGSEPAAQAGRYTVQRDLYAIAAAKTTGAERVRVAYVFLEHPAEPVIEELDATAIAAARESLESTIAELAAGRFEVTDAATWDLCHDCPARERLCSAPAEPPA
jgi:ATP-dependent exoDNAse (exonuclease V) beta subunit